MSASQAFERKRILTYRRVLVLVIVVGVIGRLVHFHLALGSDDQRWIIAAHEVMNHSNHTLDPVAYSRVLWTWALVAWGRLFGLTLESTAVLMFLLSCLTIVFVAEAARALFSSSAALLAAAVYATHPIAVMYDVQTLPDVLSVTLLSASIFFFSKFLKTDKAQSLIASALIVGLSYSAKSYFILAAMPMGVVVVFYPPQLGSRIRNSALFIIGVLIGLAANPLMSWAAGVEPYNSVAAMSGYADGLAQYTSAYEGWRATAFTLVSRLVYVQALYFAYGGAIGIVLLWASLFLVVHARGGREYIFLLGLVLVFLLFLSFMPVRLSPLIFVETQDRYLTVVLPALAIAAGQAMWTVIRSGDDAASRRALLGVALVVFAYDLAVPNDMLDRYRLLEFEGLNRALAEAPKHGIQEIVVPRYYREVIPDSFYSRGVRITFQDFGQDVANRTMDVTERSSRAFFVPRAHFRELAPKLRMGEDTQALEYGEAARLVASLTNEGLQVTRITVPDDSLRFWLDRLGIHTKGQLVAWMLFKS